MTNASLYNSLESWFEQYAESFLHQDNLLHHAVVLKREHTRRVCDEMDLLCKSMGADNENKHVCKTIALLHDVGRFEQFKRYQTFADRLSVNHAVLSLEIIEQFQLLKDYSAYDRQNILDAIRYHNVLVVPEALDDHARFLCHLIRDADKLDIFRIAVAHYADPQPEHDKIFGIGFPDIPEPVSAKVCESVYQGCMVDYAHVQSLNDFKLIQVGWVYDLNFPESLSLLKSRGHLLSIIERIPESPEVARAINKAVSYMENRITTM